jgi:FkbM family methyltransferase
MAGAFIMNLAAVITQAFEAVHLRGAPTLLRYLSKTRLSKRITTTRLPGGECFAFPAYDPYWARHLYAGVPYEPDVEAIFRRFSSGRTLIDCGANIGFWSARAKDLGFKDAIAIEANADLIQLLRRNHRGRVIHAAVHSSSGQTLFLEGDGPAAHLAQHGVPVGTIALADLGIIQPAVVKLDVEGAEVAAIEGAGDLDAIFVYEDWPKSGMPVTQYLLERGFTLYGFDMSPITTVRDALEFNGRTTTTYAPSNFVGIPMSDRRSAKSSRD